MPTTAFGRALLASARGRPQNVALTMGGSAPVRHRCSEYLERRGDEILLLDGITLPSDAAVLGLGCGQRYPLVRLLGNGLGLFGAEADARVGLELKAWRMRHTGCTEHEAHDWLSARWPLAQRLNADFTRLLRGG